MLSSLRRGGFVQFGMAAIVVLIIAGFAFTDFGRRGTPVNLKHDCVVTLGSDCVPARDFSSSFRLAVPSYLEEKEIKAQGLRKQVIEGLVERLLLLRDASRLGISVSDDDIDSELALGRVRYSLPVGTHALQMSRRFEVEANPMLTYIPVKNPTTDAFDFKVYKRSVLNYARMSTKDFKEKQREELIAARMRSLIMSQVRVAETEVFAQYQRDNSKAIARIVNLDRAWFARFTPAPAAAAVDKYAAEHQDKVSAAWEAGKASYTAGCADVSVIEVAYEGSATDEEKADAKKKLSAAAKRIKSGESFASVARQVSTAESAAIGGQLGCLPTGEDPDSKKLHEAVAALAPGDLSDVIETESGAKLLKLEKKLAEADLESAGKRLIAFALASNEEAGSKAQKFGTQLIELGRAGKSLEDAVLELSKKLLETTGGEAGKKLASSALAAENRPKVEISSNFSIAENPVPAAIKSSPAALVFGLEKADDIYAEPLETHQGYAVLQLKEKNPALREDFDAKKDQLVTDLRLRKQADALASYVRRLRAEVESKLTIDSRYFEQASSQVADEG